jgi:hypothetical protein
LPRCSEGTVKFCNTKSRKPSLTVEGPNEISNVPEGKKQFKLILENNSVSETDAVYLLKVDNRTDLITL